MYRKRRVDITNPDTTTTDTNPLGMQTLGIPCGKPSEISDSNNKIVDSEYSYTNTTKFKILDDSDKTKSFNQLLELSMQNIYSFIKKNKIDYVYYPTHQCISSGNSTKLDLKPDEFEIDLGKMIREKWTKDNEENINKQFDNLMKKLKYNINSDNGLPDPLVLAPPLVPVTGTVLPLVPALAPVTVPSLKNVQTTSDQGQPDKIHYLQLDNISSDNYLVDKNNKKINVKNSYSGEI